jgi:putative Holliday junction resolvase
MIHEDILALKAALKPGERLLGLDLGEKTIGMALSDPMLTLASPVGTIRRTNFSRDVAEMFALIDQRGVGGLVVGLPVNMDGTEGPRCQSVRDFVREVHQRRPIPATFWDERLSTSAVQRFLTSEADMTRKRRGEVVDKMAAGYILQGALDRLAFTPTRPLSFLDDEDEDNY